MLINLTGLCCKLISRVLLYKGDDYMLITIVGAGQGGTSIIDSFVNIPDIKINMVIDKSLDAPGIKLAKKYNISSSQSLNDIDIDNTDIIIEATGSNKVVEALQSQFGQTCTIIDSKAALLIMTLVERDITTIEKMNKQINIINDTSKIVEEQLQQISTSIDNIHEVSDNLLASAQISNDHIIKSDEIIQSVNKLAQQTKILGINASIEASRAGKDGAGFSIVANEVQGLAKYSQNFAEEINTILGKISEEIKKISNQVSQLDSLSKLQMNASSHVNNAVEKLASACKDNL